jgi:hypothetical protein
MATPNAPTMQDQVNEVEQDITSLKLEIEKCDSELASIEAKRLSVPRGEIRALMIHKDEIQTLKDRAIRELTVQQEIADGLWKQIRQQKREAAEQAPRLEVARIREQVLTATARLTRQLESNADVELIIAGLERMRQLMAASRLDHFPIPQYLQEANAARTEFGAALTPLVNRINSIIRF